MKTTVNGHVEGRLMGKETEELGVDVDWRKRPRKGAIQTNSKKRGWKHWAWSAGCLCFGRTCSSCLKRPTLTFCLFLYNSGSADAPVPEHLSQCQNLTLYQSFCAMKYAIYALCVNSHQHSQCQECRDSPSEDLASAAEPANDSASSPGTALLPHTPSLT